MDALPSLLSGFAVALQPINLMWALVGSILGTAIGILSVVLCAGLAVLYIPGMPAGLGTAPYVIFAFWWVLGLVFMVRIPRGIEPGADAEPRLVAAVEARKK